MLATVGAAGVAGCALMVTLVAVETHVAAFLAMKACEPAARSEERRVGKECA